jgi:hypothetical protein
VPAVELNNGKLKVIVGPGLFVPQGAKLNFVSYVVKD